MPSRKIFAVLIICVAVVASFWMVTKSRVEKNATAKNPMVEIDSTEGSSTQSDWKSVLLTLDNTPTTGFSTASSTGSSYPNEGTMTDQMAKDFLAQYLSLKQGGSSVSSDQAVKIAENIMTSDQYTKATGVVYTAENLKITSKTDKSTAQKYMNDGIALLTKYSGTDYDSVITIVKAAVQSKKESDMVKLDPIIANYKSIIAGALYITVPADAVTAHLALLNSISNTLANVEALRATFTDPVKSFAGLSQYTQHRNDISTALSGLTTYFKSKGLIK